jgi:transcriptional regulator with XRE-family HTH domain
VTQRDESLGQRIRTARKKLGLTQEALADALGTSRTHVIRWEGGKHSPDPGYRRKLAALTGEPEDYFSPSPDEALTPRYEELAAQVAEAIEAQQALVASIADRQERLETLVRATLGSALGDEAGRSSS